MLKPKIIFLCKYYPPDPGGIEKASEKLVNFSKLAYSSTILAFKKTKNQHKRNTNILKFYKSIEFFRQPISLKYFFASFFYSLKANIIYVHYPNLLVVIPVKLLKIFKPKNKVIIHYHADVVFKSKFLNFLFQYMTKIILSVSDGIIVTSSNYQSSSQHLQKFQDRIKIIPLSTETIKNLSMVKNQENKRIIFIGRLIAYKGLIEFSKNIDQIDPEAEIIIIGDGPLKTKLYSTINKLKSKKRVLIKGYLDCKHKVELLKNSDLLVLPSLTKAEAFGLVMLEAQSYGIPSVCFDIPGSGVSFVNKHKISGYVSEYKNYKQFNEYINKILRKNDFEKSNIIKYHRLNFSDSTIKKKWLKYLNSFTN